MHKMTILQVCQKLEQFHHNSLNQMLLVLVCLLVLAQQKKNKNKKKLKENNLKNKVNQLKLRQCLHLILCLEKNLLQRVSLHQFKFHNLNLKKKCFGDQVDLLYLRNKHNQLQTRQVLGYLDQDYFLECKLDCLKKQVINFKIMINQDHKWKSKVHLRKHLKGKYLQVTLTSNHNHHLLSKQNKMKVFFQILLNKISLPHNKVINKLKEILNHQHQPACLHL